MASAGASKAKPLIDEFERRPEIVMNRASKYSLLCAAALATSVLVLSDAGAQARRAAAPAQPATPRSSAPIDLTGNWVSLITDDWVYRMITPAKGDVSYVPLNPEGRRLADAWDPARDEAAGEQCKGYGAPAIMRLPSRVQITWQDDNTLKLDIDTGMQTRLFHFNQPEAQGARSWQGWSAASWHLSGTTEQFYPGPTSLGQIKRAGSLKVDTTNLRAGYLRKNGVPFSENAFMTEYFNLIVEPDGNQYLVIQTYVADARYLTGHFVRTVQFKREPDGSKRNPVACSAA
jgi:hypothetical protein